MKAHRKRSIFKLGTLGLAAMALLAASPTSFAQIAFVPDWSEDKAAQTGFFDVFAGQMRRDTFRAAANYLGTLLAPSYPGETIRVKASFQPLPDGEIGSGRPLGFTRSDSFAGASPQYRSNTDYSFALANHLAGFELNSGNQLEVIFSTSPRIPWNYSTNQTPPAGSIQVSLFTTMIHEMAHGLGFLHGIDPATGGFAYDGGLPTAFDRLLVKGALQPNPLASMSNSERLTAIASGDLYWVGPLATAANNGKLAKLYSPNPYQPGTSIAHLDPVAFGALGLVLLPRDSESVQTRLGFSGVELAMFFDMGFTPAPHPPPRIAGIVRNGNRTAISFATRLGVNYRLLSARAFSDAPGSWQAPAPALIGNGQNALIAHETSEPFSFYRLEETP